MNHERTKNILKGVRNIRYGDPSAECFIGSVIAVMEYFNDPIEIEELFALSGAGLCFPWKDNSTCDEISIIPELPKRTFQAMGYPIEYYYEPDLLCCPRAYSKEFYFKKIVESINKNRPVIGFGFTNNDPFTCIITGYNQNQQKLYFRSYWEPSENLEGDQTDTDYYCTDDWYKNCYGIIIIHEQDRKRVNGMEAYNYILDNAKIYNNIYSVPSQGKTIYLQSHAYDAIIKWLMNDEEWTEIDNTHILYLGPCGVLLLAEYRNYLKNYLIAFSKKYPDMVDSKIFSIIDTMHNCIGGEDDSFHLERISSDITDCNMLRERPVRQKVTDYIQKLKEYDENLFRCLLKN